MAAERATTREAISGTEALEILKLKRPALTEFMEQAEKLREKYHKDEIAFCGIINGKSGNCPEDCAFCSQSVHYETYAPKYSLQDADSIFKRAKELKQMGARAFSIVNAGRRLEKACEIATITEAVKRISSELQMECCASLGRCSKEVMLELKDSGICRYHHNLETARSHFKNIVTTYKYDESIETIKRAKDAGLEVCSCGIFGLGESDEQIVEFIETLKELDVDGLPVNFLNPSTGTPFGESKLLEIDKALAIIVILRLMMPEKDIIIAGGRSVVLKENQYDIFSAGANGMMVGEYLTTFNSPWLEDIEAVKSRGLKLRKAAL